MPLETNLNVSPYFDDYDPQSEYYRVLHKPGVAVQTRELNQSQAIIQNQIEEFGNHVFKSGTIVSGINFNYLENYPYVKLLDQQQDGQTALPSAYVGYFVRNTANLTARVVNSIDGLQSKAPDLKAIYLQYINSGTGGQTAYAPNDVLTVFSVDEELFSVSIVNGGVGFSNNDTVIVASPLEIEYATGAFSVGDEITQATTGAKATVVSVNTTAVEDTTIISIAPRDEDLSNTSLTAAAWTFEPGYNIVNGSNTANVISLIGTGATAAVTTDTEGIVNIVTVQSQGSDYTVDPVVRIKTSNPAADLESLSLLARTYKGRIVVGNAAVNSVGSGYAFGVSGGTIYQKGFFVKVEPQTVVVKPFSSVPDELAVGFATIESFVDSNEDESLYDNAANTTNFSAPGADRLKLVPTLVVKTIDEADSNTDFLALAEWKEGKAYKENRTTVYSNIGEEMARRTHEAHGDFVIDKFLLTTKDTPVTNSLMSSTTLDIVVDPGLAYISGVRVQTNFNDYIETDKSTAFTTATNQVITANYGNYVFVDELAGAFDFKAGDAINLYSTAKNYISTSTSFGTITAPTGQIGTARIRSLVHHSGVPGTAQARYRLYLFDIVMNRGKSFRNVRSVYHSGTPANGVADTVLAYDSTIAAFVAKLNDTSKDYMTFSTGKSAVKSISDITYTYRTISGTNLQLVNTTGELQIVLSGTAVFPYATGSSLSDNEKRNFIVSPLTAATAAANLTGTHTLSSGNTTLVGSSTAYLTELQVGDYMIFNGSAQPRQVVSIANNTSLTLQVAASGSLAGANAALHFPAHIPIPLYGRTGRTVTINGAGNTATISVGTTTGGTVNAYGVYDVRQTNASAVAKTVSRGRFVKINTANSVAGAIGPWSLGVPDVIRLSAVYIGNSTAATTSDRNVTKYFYIDAGGDENAYRNAQLVLRPGSSVTLDDSYLLIKMDVMTNGGAEGFFTIGSYPLNDTKRLANSTTTINTIEIPELVTTKGEYFDMRDVVDHRPYATATATLTANASAATVNPSAAFSLSGTDQFFPLPDSQITFTAQYYKQRVDNVVVNANGSFELIKGEPVSTAAEPPPVPRQAVLLGSITVPAYPSYPAALSNDMMAFLDKRVGNAKGEINNRRNGFTITPRVDAKMTKQARRYTMEDIGRLERRINELEYYTSLNTLENQVKDKQIPSSVTPTVSRFKHGFLVDGFNNYDVADVADKSMRMTIDQKLGILKPSTRQVNFESQFDLTDATTAASVLNDGQTLMLPFNSVVLVSQTIKTSTLSSDGQQHRFSGSGTISPTSFSINARGEITIVTPKPKPAPVYAGDGGGDGDGGVGVGCDGAVGASSCGVGDGGDGGDGGCFLTTATVGQMGLSDDCEELELARSLRDHHMTSTSDRRACEMYRIVGPVVVERNNQWGKFYSDTIVPLSSMIKAGDYKKAIKLYKLATAELVDQYATEYGDKQTIEQLFNVISPNSKLPYAAKYFIMKSVLKYKITKAKIEGKILQHVSKK
jgi:hypothetical protein